MATATTPFWRRQEELKERMVGFDQSHSDYGHIIVSRFRADESREVIGHIYSEVDGEEVRYISTNRKGREIFVRTNDFNSVEKKFERYAHLLALQERTRAFYKNLSLKNINVTFKNPNIMTTPTKQPQQTQKNPNQLFFIESEKPAGDGHFITTTDSYRNDIGKIHKIYSEELKRYEYIAYDHAGNQMAKSDKLWEVKKVFSDNKKTLLEQAHQRRIASKQKTTEVSKEKPVEKQEQVQQTKAAERKKETEQLRQDKKGREKQTDKAPDKSELKSNGKGDDKTIARENAPANREQDREQELSDLRDDQGNDRGDTDVER
jgi:hypothetical protein